MELLQSGVPLTIEWTLSDPGLTPAIKVYDDSGVSPVLVATVAMSNWYGNSYRAKFTGVDNKLYVVSKAVYTDAPTYSVIDNNYAQGSESFLTIPSEAASIAQLLALIYQFLRQVAIRVKITDNQKIRVKIQDQPNIRVKVK